jgi:RNA polymerase sigma-70 factor (ECF subfamily)
MRLSRETDARLLSRVPAPDAVREFYERHVDAVFRFAVRRCSRPEDVADLVSSVFVEVFGAARTFDAHRGGARPWLLGIAARCLADQRRESHRHRQLADRAAGMPEPRDDEYEAVERMIDAARLAPAIDRALAADLTDAERELFLLVSHDELSVADAARCLGLTPVAGRMRLARARRKLRHALAPSMPDAGVPRETPAMTRGDS